MNTVISNSSPLREVFKKYGATFNSKSEFSPPLHFGSVEKEYASLYEGTGIRDLSNGGIILMKGADTLDFLHRISTNAVKDLGENEARRSIFTNENGRIIDYVTIFRDADSIILTGSPENEEKLLKWIDKYIIVDDVSAIPVTGTYVLLEIIGPDSELFAESVYGSSVKNLPVNTLVSVTKEEFSCRLFKHRLTETIFSYRMFLNSEDGISLVQKTMDKKTGSGCELVGKQAYEIFRIENGIPESPNEINDAANPHEAGLIQDVSFTKGCYIGQEVIARLDTYEKVQRRLKRLVFTPSGIPETAYKLFSHDNKKAGVITSLSYSPKMQKTVGLGYVRKDYLENGTRLFAREEQTGDDQVNDEAFEVTVFDLAAK